MAVLTGALVALAVWLLTLGSPARAHREAGRAALRWVPGSESRSMPGSVPGLGPVAGAEGRGERTTGTLARGVRRRLRRRQGGADEELLAAVDALAPALEAGLPVPLAVEVAVSQVRDPQVRRFLTGLAEPDDLDPSGGDGVGRGGVGRGGTEGGGAGLLERAWRLCHDMGAPLAEATRTVGSLIRAERSRRRDVESALAEARATVRVLVALPLLGPALAAGIGVGPSDLYGSAASVACGVAGLALLVVGWWWMGRLVRRVGDSPRLR